MSKRFRFIFLKKNKNLKKKLLSYLIRKKKQYRNATITKNKDTIQSLYKKSTLGSRQNVQQKKKTGKKLPVEQKKERNKEFFFDKKNNVKKSQGVTSFDKIAFFLKKKLIWLKKKFFFCISKKYWRRFFKRFRSYRFFYKNYTEASLFDFLFLGKASMGELIRFASFPIKPMHFEFCYYRCEGVLLCSPQKWYNLSLLHPKYL